MMETLTPNFGAWLSGPSNFIQPQYPLYAQITWAQIQDKPVDIELFRNGATIEPQTVRVEFENTFINADSEIGTGSLRRGTIHGVRGHPDIDDLDIDAWDTFVMDEVEFTVVFVNKTLPGEIQADFEAV